MAESFHSAPDWSVEFVDDVRRFSFQSLSSYWVELDSVLQSSIWSPIDPALVQPRSYHRSIMIYPQARHCVPAKWMDRTVTNVDWLLVAIYFFESTKEQRWKSYSVENDWQPSIPISTDDERVRRAVVCSPRTWWWSHETSVRSRWSLKGSLIDGSLSLYHYSVLCQTISEHSWMYWSEVRWAVLDCRRSKGKTWRSNGELSLSLYLWWICRRVIWQSGRRCRDRFIGLRRWDRR